MILTILTKNPQEISFGKDIRYMYWNLCIRDKNDYELSRKDLIDSSIAQEKSHD